MAKQTFKQSTQNPALIAWIAFLWAILLIGLAFQHSAGAGFAVTILALVAAMFLPRTPVRDNRTSLQRKEDEDYHFGLLGVGPYGLMGRNSHAKFDD